MPSGRERIHNLFDMVQPLRVSLVMAVLCTVLCVCGTANAVEACDPQCLTPGERNSITLAESALDDWAGAIEKTFHQNAASQQFKFTRGISITADAIDNFRSVRDLTTNASLRHFYGQVIEELSEARDLFSHGQGLYAQRDKNTADLIAGTAGAIADSQGQANSSSYKDVVEPGARLLLGSDDSFAAMLNKFWDTLPEELGNAAVILQARTEIPFALSSHWPISGPGAIESTAPAPEKEAVSAPVPTAQSDTHAAKPLVPSPAGEVTLADIGTFDSDAAKRITNYCSRFSSNPTSEANCHEDEASAYVQLSRRYPTLSVELKHICTDPPFLGNFAGLLQCAELRLEHH